LLAAKVSGLRAVDIGLPLSIRGIAFEISGLSYMIIGLAAVVSRSGAVIGGLAIKLVGG
jgi:hypothetical protein